MASTSSHVRSSDHTPPPLRRHCPLTRSRCYDEVKHHVSIGLSRTSAAVCTVQESQPMPYRGGALLPELLARAGAIVSQPKTRLWATRAGAIIVLKQIDCCSRISIARTLTGMLAAAHLGSSTDQKQTNQTLTTQPTNSMVLGGNMVPGDEIYSMRGN